MIRRVYVGPLDCLVWADCTQTRKSVLVIPVACAKGYSRGASASGAQKIIRWNCWSLVPYACTDGWWLLLPLIWGGQTWQVGGGGEEKKMVMVYFGRMWSLACCSRVRHKTNGSSDPESEEGPVQIPGVSKPGNRPIVSTSALFLYVGLDVPRRDAI